MRRYEGRGLVGEKYLLQNVSQAPMVLAEQEFDRPDSPSVGAGRGCRAPQPAPGRDHQRLRHPPRRPVMVSPLPPPQPPFASRPPASARNWPSG
jgi:hypothetical protein